MNYRTTLVIDGQTVTTLADILPPVGPMKLLIIAKTPAPVSVAAGHYFQGKHGQQLWRFLQTYGLLTVPDGKHADEMLLAHGYGITDIAKAPRPFGVEPSRAEYQAGLERVLGHIATLQPRVVLFVYKRVLDNMLKLAFGLRQKSQYGFNPALELRFQTAIFVFPMPGTPATKPEAALAMRALVERLSG
jgi:mismatch-specific thymine-DNA glycosylase